MKCLYINLDHATARRASLEASFRAHAPAGWELVRIAARGPADVADIAGAITPVEKACWNSHRAALAATLDEPEDVLIVEDDTRFGPSTFRMIERVRGANLEWDLCFTETSFNVEKMLVWAQRYPGFAAAGSISVYDLAQREFAGATGFLLRGVAKAKVLALVDAADSLDKAYDFFLRDLTHAGRIKSLLCFPFITQPSGEAEASQIQPDAYRVRDHIHLAFRRLMCLDRDLDAIGPELDRLAALRPDRGALLFGRMMGALAALDGADETK